jgi:ABC-type microcin C transport system duplicated ATPase subunit YejF
MMKKTDNDDESGCPERAGRSICSASKGSTSLRHPPGLVRCVRDLDLEIKEGETLALVGESGCGKSVTAHAITQLVPCPGRIDVVEGSYSEGTDLLTETRDLREIRGSDQHDLPGAHDEPEPGIHHRHADKRGVLTHSGYGKKDAFGKAVELLIW